MVLTAVAEVGTAMSVVGMVTGNKTLTKIGGVMGLVGGIGGLAAGAAGGAGAAGAADSAGMDAAAASDAGNGLSSGAASDAAGSALSDAAASDAGSLGSDALSGTGNGLVGSAAAPLDSAVSTAPVTQPVSTSAPDIATATQAPAVTDVASQSGNLAPQGVTAPVGATAPVTPSDYAVGGRVGPDNIDVGGGFNPASGGAPQTSSDFFDGFMKFANSNKQLINSGTQLIGGALKGAADTDMFNQKMALAQAQFQRANSVGSFAPTAFSPAGGIIGRAAQ